MNEVEDLVILVLFHVVSLKRVILYLGAEQMWRSQLE
jgi:hypothetical protein